MKTIVEYILERQHFLVKSHTRKQQSKSFQEVDLTFNTNIDNLDTFIDTINKNDLKIVEHFFKGKEYKTSMTIKLNDCFMHIFRYENIKHITFNIKLSKTSEWPNAREWSYSHEYNSYNMPSAPLKEFGKEFIGICKNHKKHIKETI